ncbi:Glycosyltransferase AglD [uncultured archaeon]|nr:Glycosyltransferase AglD [uncultured archaeon]
MNGLSLIIPAHNSEKVIESSIISYYNALSRKFKQLEIIVICNDSSDNTAKICSQLGKKLPIKVIEIPYRGKGYALIEGFNTAKFEILGFLDADNPFDLEEILKMINLLEKSKVVIASKYIKGDHKKQDSLQRRIISLGGNLASKILFNLSFRDTQAGAKFFKREVWEKITEKKPNFTCNGFDWDLEFLYRVTKKNFAVEEFYIPVQQGKFSTFRLKYIPGILKRLLLLRFVK